MTASQGTADTGALKISVGPRGGTDIVASVNQTTISNNVVRGVSAYHGGLYISGSSGANGFILDLANTTISGNAVEAPAGTASVGALGASGGIGANDLIVNLASTTITNNSASGRDARYGGLHLESGSMSSVTIDLRNTVIADNHAPIDPECGSAGIPLQSAGYNLFGVTGSCGISGDATGDRSGTSGLGPLGDNGGPTRTHAPLPGSQVVNAGNPASCVGPGHNGAALTVDQRGQPRINGGDAISARWSCDRLARVLAAQRSRRSASANSRSRRVSMTFAAARAIAATGARG